MSETQHEQQNPKAAAKAAKAYVKASRPWYKKKRWIAAIVVGVIVVAAALGSGGEDGATRGGGSGGSDDSAKVTQADPVAIGESVELEGTTYTVNSAKTQGAVGSEFFSEEAGGIYVVIELTIENTKGETKTFSDTAAKLVGSNEKKYSTDNDGTFAAIGDDGEALIFEDMQPDVPKTGILVFDVPEDAAKGAQLEVSDLFGRGTAYVDLGL